VEPLDDSHYLEPPNDPPWCEAHDQKRPCPDCKAEYEEWQGEQKRETR